MKGFEAEHLPCDALDEPMALLKDIVQIFDLQDFDGLPCFCELQDDIHGFQPRVVSRMWWKFSGGDLRVV